MRRSMAVQRTSTLSATERSMRPLVLAVTVGCDALAAVMLWVSHSSQLTLAWLVCLMLSLAPAASNLRYMLTHTLTTIGMTPVALFSLLPALASVCLAESVSLHVRIACLIAAIPLAMTLALFIVWFSRLRSAYHARPQISDDATLIVLGGAIKHGRPCETLARRLDVTARLWHESPGRLIVCTGGPTPDLRTTEADEMARYLREQGVAASQAILERKARNTRENILNSCELLEQRGIAGQLCVVSSDYHLWRALRDARTVGIALTPVAAPTPTASIPQQWCREVLTILAGR